MGQLVIMASNKSQGTCPSNNETNLENHVKAITSRRNGRQLEGKPQNGDEKDERKSKSTPNSLEQLLMNEEKKQKEKKLDPVKFYVPPVSFPQCLRQYK